MDRAVAVDAGVQSGIFDRVVGFFSHVSRPSFEGISSYQFRRVDPSLLSDFMPWRLCLVEAHAHEIGNRVRDARLLLGDDCHLIALIFGDGDAGRVVEALDAGADDALLHPDEGAISTALLKGERFAAKLDRLEMRVREAELTRAAGQLALDNLPTPIFFKNREGIYTWCNKAFEAFLGLSAQAIIGKSVFEISPPELARVYHDADEALMQEGGTQIYDAEVNCATTGRRKVTFHKAATVDTQSRRVVGLAGAMLDVTDRSELEKKLKTAAECDPLTGAFNRRKFFELAHHAERQHVTSGIPFCTLVLDVDHFKQVNDSHGHACGDEVLCQLSDFLRAGAKTGDIVARAGGEEFYCLIHGQDLEQSLKCGEYIRRLVDEHEFIYEGKLVPMTVSIGLAEHRADEPVSETIRRADKALYIAKDSGRNRVCGD
ncbi:diguanylate cyclase [Roseibium sp.]|uniref:sensor domain-containing diguanylate cyclase n=1 Tax=Roseibium sp. TaxID=1936156 RepID=UPI003A9815ED